MPSFGPVKRRDLITFLRRLGYSGPYAGGRHEFMHKGDIAVVLPNPHRADVGRDLLARILRQAGVSREDWERL
jgi:predicted RNA binding protein YcfA (HicA-like mRNA interferase family)